MAGEESDWERARERLGRAKQGEINHRGKRVIG